MTGLKAVSGLGGYDISGVLVSTTGIKGLWLWMGLTTGVGGLGLCVGCLGLCVGVLKPKGLKLVKLGIGGLATGMGVLGKI